MKHKKYYKIDEQLHDKIISVAYGDAGLIDKIKIYLLANNNVEVKSLLNEYKSTSKAVHSIEKEFMPEELLARIKTETGIKNNENRSFFFDFYSFIFSRPVISAAAAVILIAVIITSAFLKGPGLSNSTYSPEEIALANKQAKQALAIVGKVFNQTEKAIKNDILAKRVGQPINKGLTIVNDLFKEENKDEKLN